MAAPGTPPVERRVLRLAIIDPRRLIAEALAFAVHDEATVEVVATAWGEVSTGEIAETAPDMALVGVGADEERALTLIDALSRRLPSAEIVLVADAPTRRPADPPARSSSARSGACCSPTTPRATWWRASHTSRAGRRCCPAAGRRPSRGPPQNRSIPSANVSSRFCDCSPRAAPTSRSATVCSSA